MAEFTIDCTIPFQPDIDIERKNSATGEWEAYTPLTGITMLLSADRGSASAIHANLIIGALERTSTPGRLYSGSPFAVADLQAYVLPTYVNKKIYLNLFKSGELFYEPFTVLVRKDRLGG